MGEPLTPVRVIDALIDGGFVNPARDGEAAEAIRPLFVAARAAAPSPEPRSVMVGDDYDIGENGAIIGGPPAPVPVAGLREAAQRVMDSHRKGYWSVDEFDALEAALLDSDRPGLDVEQLARARHATWWECIPEVSWGSCGAVNHRLEAEQTAAEYARLQETPDDE